MNLVEDVKQVGFLCDDKLLLDVEGELVSLKFDKVKNAFTEVSVYRDSEFSKFANQVCKEVNAQVDKLYTTRYYPRVYYTVFRIVTELSKTYLLEQFNGTTGLVMFYLCRSFRLCLKKIDKLEED
jgi:hypothetical protein